MDKNYCLRYKGQWMNLKRMTGQYTYVLTDNPEEIKYLSKTQALSTRAVIAEDNRLEKEDIEIVKMD